MPLYRLLEINPFNNVRLQHVQQLHKWGLNAKSSNAGKIN